MSWEHRALPDFSLTDEQWAVIAEAVAPASNWNVNNRRGPQTGALDRRTAVNDFLNALRTGQGVTSAHSVSGRSLSHLITRLSDGAQLGFALGLLYRHLNTPMLEIRKERSTRRGGDADWRRQTDALFLSDGMIELMRWLNPALHRELVARVLLGKRLPE
ncbi:hypothetical protein [Deinococcus sp. Marseille-Q6407]|uniref:hypothetical protein n=1 Tax=Deinococcus sp. Marseille-Q6407 TaxID=2969223 RepID=UPI0021BE7300|nr:hypothetical protein [Deinococcus sp. Marseille-Q6407]